MKSATLLITVALGLLLASYLSQAQPPTHVHRIGVLLDTTPGRDPYVGAFLEGMRALGYVEGQHFVLEVRGVEGQYEQLPALAAELVRLKVDGIVTYGMPPSVAQKLKRHPDHALRHGGFG
jgi:putative ABC transport system substrate-binding protein